MADRHRVPDTLTPIERGAFRLFRYMNETEGPKRFQQMFHSTVGRFWVGQSLKNVLHVKGLDILKNLDPDRGVLMCSNHRSFFDQYVLLYVMVEHAPWLKEIYCPVRSNFFYDTIPGIAINLTMAMGAMYPPVFRDPLKSEFNRVAVEKMVEFLRHPGAVVGVHPEGTRNKGVDPYTLLKVHPGAGQMARRAHPIVLPVFCNGLSNDFVSQLKGNFKNGGRDAEPVIASFGKPVELDDLLAQPPRLRLHMQISQRICEHILLAAEGEKELRAELRAAREARQARVG